MIKENKDIKGTVTKSNLLVIRSKYHLTNDQDRILRYLISQLPNLSFEDIQEIEKESDSGDYRKAPVITLKLSDYQELINLTDSGTNYSRVKSSIRSLESQRIWVQDPNRQNGEITTGWIMRSKIDKGSGDIEIVIDPYILRYIRGLKERFITYQVTDSVKMKSIYSRMLYDVILTESWKDGEYHSISVDDLRKYFQLEEGKYPRFNNFRMRCIDPAIEDINQYTDLQVTCETIMSGRTCKSVRFRVVDKNKGKSKKKTGKRVDFNDPNCKLNYPGQESMDLNAMDPDKKTKPRRPRQNKQIHNFEERQTDYDSIVNQRVLNRMNTSKE